MIGHTCNLSQICQKITCHRCYQTCDRCVVNMWRPVISGLFFIIWDRLQLWIYHHSNNNPYCQVLKPFACLNTTLIPLLISFNNLYNTNWNNCEKLLITKTFFHQQRRILHHKLCELSLCLLLEFKLNLQVFDWNFIHNNLLKFMNILYFSWQV